MNHLAFNSTEQEQLLTHYKRAQQSLEQKIKRFDCWKRPVSVISDEYPGVWLEASPYDGLQAMLLNGLEPDIAVSNVDIFMANQKADGQLPCIVLDPGHPRFSEFMKAGFSPVSYGQIQELVPFAWVCWRLASLTQDEALLARAYEACCRWDAWLVKYRQTRGLGAFEMFCEFDMGMDNCPRVIDGGIPPACPDYDARQCADVPALPLLAPDQSAVVYGARCALAEMAQALNRNAEADTWRNKAEQLRLAVIEHCWDAEDAFFYDLDAQGQLRKYRTIHITFLLSEGIAQGASWERIYQRYLKNENEFWTRVPFPSVSISDPCFPESTDGIHGNSWGFWSNSPMLYRLSRWMKPNRKEEDLKVIMERWLASFLKQSKHDFTQGVHPLTGEWCQTSAYHSNTLLFYLESMQTLGLSGRLG